MDVVTGSTGCLGNVITRELLKRDRKVRVFLRPTSDTCSIDDCGTDRVFGDLMDIDSLIKAFSGAENVYHAAAEVTIMPGNKNTISDINHYGTRNVIEACKRAGVAKLIYTSSIHALKAPDDNNKVIDESCPFDLDSKKSIYNRSKARASKEVVEANGSDLKTVALCPTAIIGPYDFRISHLGQFFIDYCNGKMSFITDGAYDFVDVRDVAIGHILASSKGRPGNIYLLSGQRVTLDELVRILEEITGVPKPKYKIPSWLAYFASFFATVFYQLTSKKPRFTKYSIATINSNSNISSRKAEEELGFSARDVGQSIKDSIGWFKQKGLIDLRI